MTLSSLRDEFVAKRPYPLDDFQVAALNALDSGHSVLVAAPTGSGKTLVAEYAIHLALAAMGKVFYTTPLKALSNQKYSDLVREHGSEAVGLLTGDNAINSTAPIVVMTTEVLRNMIYANSASLNRLRYVILDEVHYLQNRFRGAVWEEVIIQLALDVDLVCLSATVSNAEEFADWIRAVRGETTAIIEERRPVELSHLYAVGDRSAETIHLLPLLLGDGEDVHLNHEAQELDERPTAQRSGRGRNRKLYSPWRGELIERLRDDDMLPAIYFIFSRNACDDAVRGARREGIRLTNSDELLSVREIAERHTAGLSEDDLAVLGYGEWLDGLEAGIAAHHAGLVPPMKEAVEEAFCKGLVKVVFATETLGLGINMPARSVVIEKLSKFTGEHHEILTPGEYTQLAGRAGRRGIDDVGYSIVCWNAFVKFDQVASLVGRRSYELTSSFRPTYNMAVNLIRRCAKDRAHELLNQSFAQYHADRDVVGLETQIKRQRDLLHRLRETADDQDGMLADYRSKVLELESLKKSTTISRSSRFESLRTGDIVAISRKAIGVVVKQDRGRAPGRVLVITDSGRLLRLDARDFPRGVSRIGALELPRPTQPRNPDYVANVTGMLARATLDPRQSDDSKIVEDLEAQIALHPIARDPHRSTRLRAAFGVERSERDLNRLERRVADRGESLARQFDRVLDVLAAWGYTDGWNLTESGSVLCGLYTESDLLVAEAIADGLFDGLDQANLAALTSAFTFERRGPESDNPRPPRNWPSREVAKRCNKIERTFRELQNAEFDAHLKQTRAPDPGFTAAVARWVRGEELAEILDEEEMTGGDFVRNIKQLIDLLRQIGIAAPNPATRHTANSAADACTRGVVEASSRVGG